MLKFYIDDCWRTGWNGPNDVLEMTISRCFIIFSDICQLRLDFDNFDIVETTTGCVISTPFPLYFLVLGCWELSNMIFLMLREKELLVNLSNFTTWQLFSPKWQPRTILSENSCHYVNVPLFTSSSFFLSLRKITWLNFRQPKTKGYVEHRSHSSIYSSIMGQNYFEVALESRAPTISRDF